MKSFGDFKDYIVVDYEFSGGNKGNQQKPVCYATKNLTTGVTTGHWITGKEIKPIYSTDKDTLFIAFYSSAEIRCHKVLDFETPLYILDLYVEFRNLTNGLSVLSSLLGTCDYFGIKHSDTTYKKSMQDRIIQGEPFSEKEKRDILKYCEQDVELTAVLFEKMKSLIDLNSALLRGRYMSAVAVMENNGIPIDIKKLKQVQDCWDIIKEDLIAKVDQNYDVYEGTTFKIDKFKTYLKKNGMSWELTPSGLPKTDSNYMQQQAKVYPKLKPLQELKHTLGQLRLNDLRIGVDGRNRCLLSPFRSKTGRNQPSTSKFIFGPSTWIRFFIKPEPNTAIAYVDYAQQEIAIAGVLSGDKNLIKDYETGDPYLAFAKKSSAIPPDGTRETHPEVREIYKRCMLALNYGMSIQTFANDTQIPYAEADYIVKWHKRRYHKYWEWIDKFIDMGMLTGLVKTKYNWKFYTQNAKYRTLQNWPMQSHGAEILRLAIMMCIENDIKVIAPIHDAILIEAPLKDIDQIVKKTQDIMEYASKCVLDLKITTDTKIFKHPDNFFEARGETMWNSIWNIIGNINPNEIAERLKDKVKKEMVSLDLEYAKPGKQTLKEMLLPKDLPEKQLLHRIKEKSGWPHISLMHLIREARETDFDIEEEIDWEYDTYATAKKRIHHRIKSLTGEY